MRWATLRVSKDRPFQRSFSLVVLVAGQWQTFWGRGELLQKQKQPSNVFVLAVKTANKQRNGKDRGKVHIPNDRFKKMGKLRMDAP